MDVPSDDETTLPVEVDRLVAEPSDDEAFAKIKVGDQQMIVTRKSVKLMTNAIDATTNQPTVYYKCKFAIDAAANILGVEPCVLAAQLETGVLHSFDWDSVVLGRNETYPQSTQPTEMEFEKVRSVYTIVLKEKDEMARASGLPKSGVQSYKTFKQRWKQFRDYAAIYRHMNPALSNKTLIDLMTVQLKGCASIKAIDEVVTLEMKKAIAKRKRDAKKSEDRIAVASKLEELNKKEQEVKKGLKEAQEDLAKIVTMVKEKEKELMDSDNQVQCSTRAGKQRRQAAIQTELRQRKEEELEASEELKLAKEAEEKLQSEKQQLVAKQAAVALPEPHDAGTKSKKAKRNDPSLLDLQPTPRKKVELDGDTWKPPTRMTGQAVKYQPPGNAWANNSIEKIQLLMSLAGYMKDHELLEQPLTFRSVMEFIGADHREEELDFNDRVFIHLVALCLYQHCSFSDVIETVLGLFDSKLWSIQLMAASTPQALTDSIGTIGGYDNMGQELYELATEITNNAGGTVPTNHVDLVERGVDETVARQLMQQVFGSTEIYIGLNIRKVLCAIDCFDWEESGATSKQDIKMVKIPEKHVKASLMTWLPKGDGLAFQDLIEALGSALGSQTIGYWGKMKNTIGQRYPPKAKDQLIKMISDITRFYKVTKSGKRKRSSPA